MCTWLLLLAAPAARAFAPTDGVPGPDYGRIRYQNPAEQGRWLASPAWKRWLASDGKGWEARFDEATGTPRWMWGHGIPMPVGEDELVAALAALLDAHADLLGYEAGTLALRSANYSGDVDSWYVEFDPLRSGLRTWRGGISARIKHGNLVMLGVATAPRAEVVGAIHLAPATAISRAIALGPAPGADHRERSADPMLLEQKSLQGHVLRAAWLVRTRTADPPGRWVSFVDAESGALLGFTNEVRYASGTVQGKHHERTVDGSPLVIDPMPYVLVGSDGSFTNADDSGNFTVGGNGPYDTVLDGDYLTMKNDAGAEGSLSDGSTDLLWTSADATQAELDSYVFLHQVKAWGEIYAPAVAWVQGPITAHVNLNSNCNAYWDGTVNFFSAGGGCNNTGQIADVVYHEWGHGFHYDSLRAGTFDGSLSEGASDVVSFLQTLDHELGPYFETNGAPVRDVAPNKKYPQDYVNNDNYVHDNGLIFGGAMWDLLVLLTDEEGLQPGIVSTSEIHAGLLKGGPDVPGSFYEALVADDDDGDLGNGTPHVCELFDAFGDHGLGTSSGVEAVLVSHEPVSSALPNVAVPIDVDLVSVAAGCSPAGADDAVVHYRVGKDGWDTAALSTSGNAVRGEIPGQSEGSFVEYYVTGHSDDGTPFSSPSGESINPYTFYVGDTLDIRCDDFEDDAGGYETTAGFEWEHGVPSGFEEDPSGAYSGTKVWGIDLAHDGLYEKFAEDALQSPMIDTGHYTGVFVQYRRWLAVEDGTYDHATIRVNGSLAWQNYVGSGVGGEDATRDGAWVNHAVDLGGMGDRSEIRVEFGLDSDLNRQLGGWNIDDVCILAPATPDNRLGITDFTAVATSDTTVQLKWTNPAHAPLERVRVVRRLDRFPESSDDGEVAEEVDNVGTLDEVTVEDVNGHPGTTWYAVYGYDGADWLPWTIEGWNAAKVDLVGGEVPLEDKYSSDVYYYPLVGCGCNGSPSGGGALVLLLVAVAGRRRS